MTLEQAKRDLEQAQRDCRKLLDALVDPNLSCAEARIALRRVMAAVLDVEAKAAVVARLEVP